MTESAVTAMTATHEMQVVKRNGSKENISFDKIVKRLRSLSTGLHVDPVKVSQKVIESLYDGVTTTELDIVSASTAAHLSTEHPDYSDFAGRIAVSNHQKNTLPSFYKTVKMLYEVEDINGKHSPVVSKQLYDITKKHRKEIEDAIDYDRDFQYDYFGFQTLTRAYLLKVKGQIVERIQHMLMRVSLGIHGSDLTAALETYDLMSRKQFTHATPTLYNAGTPRPQNSSCFLLGMEDSIEGIFKAITQCAYISKWAGGIGIHIHDIRAKGSPIYGTNGTSNGLVPLLRTVNACARFVDQCLINGTLETSSGLRSVKDLCLSDRVLGSDGLFHRVLKILEHDYKGEVIDIYDDDKVLAQVTPSQQLKIVRNIDPSRRPYLDKAEWVEATDLIEGDYLVYTTPRRENFKRLTEDVPELSLEDCKFLGLTVQYGGLGNLVLPNARRELYDFATGYLQDRYLKYDTLVEGPHTSIVYSPQNMAFSRSALKLPKPFWHLPDDKTKALLTYVDATVGLSQEVELAVRYITAGPENSADYKEIKKLKMYSTEGYVSAFDIVCEDSADYVSSIGVLHGAQSESSG